ncbi:hypothetical protein TNCV_4654271 [Trichonephila clavipes]|nr:hypothetical protein TNCV_4654271 [Trichonephila clavipes]
MWPRLKARKADFWFCLSTGHDCLQKHLHRIHVAQAPFCMLFWEDMDADLIRHFPDLKGFSLCEVYWQARDLLGS